MTTDWLLTTKPAFLNECLALQPKEFMQVQKKLVLLTEDPTPDAKTKKQLKNWEGWLHRLRSGNFRIFYTFETPYISVLALRRRSEDNYEDLESEFLGGPGGEAHDPTTKPATHSAGDAWNRWLEPAPVARQGLSRTIDKALLDGLKIPKHLLPRAAQGRHRGRTARLPRAAGCADPRARRGLRSPHRPGPRPAGPRGVCAR